MRPVIAPPAGHVPGGESEAVAVDLAVGRISTESIAGYPPGIPTLLPGERITAEVVEYLRALTAAGANRAYFHKIRTVLGDSSRSGRSGRGFSGLAAAYP